MRPIATCRLCLREQPLCASHILPEFVYTPIYENHKAVEVARDREKARQFQKGMREHLLCEGCEQKLNVYETYFANLGLDPVAGLRDDLAREVHAIVGLDYLKFKLFHVSVLWRASVTSLNFFKAVSLGERWERRARSMLIKNDPGLPAEFPICAMALEDADGSRLGTRMLMDVMTKRMGGHRAYLFFFGGYLWHYFVSTSWPAHLRSFCLNQVGQLLIIRQNIHRDPEFAHMAPLFQATR